MNMYYLKQLRAKKGVSQRVVADYLGITNQAYSNYENGKRQADYETQLKLAAYFAVPLDEMFHGPAHGKTPAHEGAEALAEQDRQLLVLFARLSDEDRGRMLERAEMLAAQTRAQEHPSGQG